MFQKIILAIGLVFATAAAHADVEVKPALNNDMTLQNLIYDIQTAYSWTCTGQTCYDVWRNEINALENFSGYADRWGGVEFVSFQTGEQAFRAAQRICGTSIYGDQRWLIAVTNAENRALPRLRYVQQMAGVQNPYFCTKYIR